MVNIIPKVLTKLMAMPKFQALIVKASTPTIHIVNQPSADAHINANSSINANINSSKNDVNCASNSSTFTNKKIKNLESQVTHLE